MDIARLFSEWIWPLLGFLLGLGLVVFVHELGHFLAAKAVGIKVEKFAMGIGPKVWSFRRGETEYCLNLLLPVGGYVKMLGQDDVRPPLEAKAGEAAAALKEGDPGYDPFYDPRAFQNKTIGQRMLVIAGGVVMNVILALVLFIIVGVSGKPFPAPVLGDVLPGTPASQAAITWQVPPTRTPTTSPAFPNANVGLRPGDKITRIDGDRFLMRLLDKDVDSFTKVQMIALLANDDDQYTITFERQEGNRTLVGEARLGVRVATSEMGTQRRGFGIRAAFDTTLGLDESSKSRTLYKAGDRLLSIAGHKVEHEWDLPDILKGLDGNDVNVTVLRDGNQVSLAIRPQLDLSIERELLFDPNAGVRLVAMPGRQPNDSNLVRVETPDGNVLVLVRDKLVAPASYLLDMMGMIPRVSVAAVGMGTPASKAGLEPGDILVEYGDVRNPTQKQLREINKRAVEGGANLVVLRDGNILPSVHVTPAAKNDEAFLGFNPTPDVWHPVVAGVRENSPAARAGLLSSDVIEQVNGRPVKTWIDLLRAVEAAQGQDLKITVQRGSQTLVLDLGTVDRAVFDPSDYRFGVFGAGVGLEPLLVTIRKDPLEAIGWGVNQTWEGIITTYATLRQLIFAHTVSPREAAGPIGVGQMAVLMARRGFMQLVYLMAIISASVAVINFLPFPVLDGGHAVLLIVEKVRGRPLPPKAMWGIQIFGLVCILLLFVLLTWNDIARMIRG